MKFQINKKKATPTKCIKKNKKKVNKKDAQQTRGKKGKTFPSSCNFFAQFKLITCKTVN